MGSFKKEFAPGNSLDFQPLQTGPVASNVNPVGYVPPVNTTNLVQNLITGTSTPNN